MKYFVVLLMFMILLTSCKEHDMKTVEYVDINKFMGDWYVISIIPNFIEKHAINGIESYEILDENRVKIDYRFTDKRNGKVKHMQPKAWIYDKESYSEWRVQFVWPIKFPYLIIDLAEDYSYTVIGVPNKKFVWIMARKSYLPDETYSKILTNLQSVGYDISKIKTMPQIWE
ncbi:MAG: lipocalin family protein [Candidatus Cloacimonetes bacterium]|nr:lipocalin family protein [Candidatus Cloacimonadota bacterium]MCF7814187.1 lipocalin family protein [Candidatus Cloacimonadota bacterium]MCF7868864.1 lipocalin family protein [Candidatus Cloacimonadota bacterium]MCF7884243.1 lipocalin family protein [Candidatus Cloacimonadota bacterium]